MSRYLSLATFILFGAALVWMSSKWSSVQYGYLQDYPELLLDPIQTMWPAFICCSLICAALLVRLLLLQFYKDASREVVICAVQILVLTIGMIMFFLRGPVSILGVIAD